MLYRQCIAINCTKSPKRCSLSYSLYSKICILHISKGCTIHYQESLNAVYAAVCTCHAENIKTVVLKTLKSNYDMYKQLHKQR